MTRRNWMATVGAAAVSSASAATAPVRCEILDHEGKPVPAEALARFHVCDLLLRPSPIAPTIGPGEVAFEPPDKPFRISVQLKVPGFGHVFLYADHGGAGYTRAALAASGRLLLNFEFAADRLATVRRLAEDCRKLGVVIPAATDRRIAAAGELQGKAGAMRRDPAACARLSMESLRESLWAGESLVQERAKHRIARQARGPGFLFGCNAFEYASGAPWYREQYSKLFNYATLPFYRGMVEPKHGTPDFSAAEGICTALQGSGILAKGHPLIFLVANATPDWLKNRPFDETKAACLAHVRESIRRFRSRIHVWDVVNEAHVQPDEGMAGFTREQNVELTAAALQAAREADPTCFRVVNNTGTWSDYYMGRKPAPWQQSVYDYVARLRTVGAEYEAIGLQYYHSGRDMLEFERNLETFAGFGKPVHVTELGFPSTSEEAPGNEWWGGGVGGARFVWHGEQFTEASQADWYEQLYTIAYSKPWVQAISTWDFADPAFLPQGGLVRQDGTPKESYRRLAALLSAWRRNS